jgi:glycine reductase
MVQAPEREQQATGTGSQRLELATYEVKDVVLGDKTGLSGGVLTVNAAELKNLILESSDWFGDVHVSIARPGDDLRIIHALDIIEPRVRVTDPGTDFPGMLSLPRTVGNGRTNRLSGMTVLEIAEPVPGEPTYWREAILDMEEEGSKYSPFSKLIHLVLTFDARADRFPDEAPETLENVFEGTPESVEYNRAIREAGLRAAVYLAEATKDLEPDSVEIYDLNHEIAKGLPKVVYLFQLSMPYVYGEVAPGGGGVGGVGSLPTLIHPNEILDGALVNAFAWTGSSREATYMLQHHAVIDELYSRHGNELDFAGVIIYTFGDSLKTKERISSYNASLARSLGADGAIINYLGGGHPIVDVMLTCQKLEGLGISTTLLLMEMAGNPEDSGFVHYVREADAIVSTGNYEAIIELPAVTEVWGGTNILVGGEDASGPLSITLRHVLGATHQFGGFNVRGTQY